MRPKKSSKNKRGHDPPTASRSSHSNDTAIELTTQRKRDLLASVGFLEEDEELPDVRLAGSYRSSPGNYRSNSNNRSYRAEEEYYHEKEERRRRKKQMKNEHSIDFDEVDFDYDEQEQEHNDLLSCDDEDASDASSQCSEHESSSSQSKRCNVTSKLIWILAIAAAFMYIFNDDSSTPDDSDEVNTPKHEYYSYKGYKDGRIPDDDLAQYGGGLLFHEDETSNNSGSDDDNNDASAEYGIGANNNLDTNPLEYDNDAKTNKGASFSKHPTGVPNEDSLWQDLAGYADLSEKYDPEAGDIAYFWHIPKCGGTTLQDLMMHCIGMVGANEVGGAYVADNEPLKIVQLENGNRYVNVDVTQPNGIQHAYDLGFASAELADVVISSRFYNVASLFSSNQKLPNVARGRCFTLLRHPVRRAISMFYYLRDATWENTYSEIYKNMTIEEYADSQYAEDNWMVRFLTNEMSGLLGNEHLDLAKQILQGKCLVGIMEEFPKSVKRFDRYFGWNQTDFEGGPVKMSDRGVCEARVMNQPDNAHAHPNFDEGSTVWVKLMQKNMLDLDLYEHAVELFHNAQPKMEGRT